MNDCGKMKKEDLKYFNLGFEISKQAMQEFIKEHPNMISELRKKIYMGVFNIATPKSTVDERNLLCGIEVGISDTIIDLLEGKE